MLESVGFTTVGEMDRTEEFAAVARAWIEQWDRHHADLVAVFGARAVEQRQADRRAQLRAIEDAVLSRSLFTAVRPGARDPVREHAAKQREGHQRQPLDGEYQRQPARPSTPGQDPLAC